MGKITINKSVYSDMEKALKNSMLILKQTIEEDKEIPFQTGELQESGTVVKVNNDTYRLEYTDDNAETIYYFYPENGWHTEQGDHEFHNGKRHKDWNENARSRWLDAYINHPDVLLNIYIDCLKATANWLF